MTSKLVTQRERALVAVLDDMQKTKHFLQLGYGPRLGTLMWDMCEAVANAGPPENHEIRVLLEDLVHHPSRQVWVAAQDLGNALGLWEDEPVPTALDQFIRAWQPCEKWHTGGNIWVARRVIETSWCADKWHDTVAVMASPTGDDGEWLVSIETYDHLLGGELVGGWNFRSDIEAKYTIDAVQFANECVLWFETTGTMAGDEGGAWRHLVGSPEEF